MTYLRGGTRTTASLANALLNAALSSDTPSPFAPKSMTVGESPSFRELVTPLAPTRSHERLVVSLLLVLKAVDPRQDAPQSITLFRNVRRFIVKRLDSKTIR